MKAQGLIQGCLLAGIVAFLGGCAAYTTTRFTEYRGPSEFQGQGGTVRQVDGIDVWETGTPNKKFKVLGLIQQSNYDNHTLMSTIAKASKDSEIIREAKTHGGDAVIILGSSTDVSGFSTSGTVQGTQHGTLNSSGGSGYYSGNYQGNVRSTTRANTTTQKAIAVIKYLE